MMYGNGYPVPVDKIGELQKQFTALEYEVEEGRQMGGNWYWFRVKCKAEDIPLHVARLKESLDLKKINPEII
jgi:hypothetical protein